jgi:sulfate adenylyltransferase subunit 1
MHAVSTLAATPLRFTTAGSVDDGKSTLIGRLLWDSKSLLSDQVIALEAGSRRAGQMPIDFSLVTDGLLAEREQGITIDVAYRYFATPARKFIIGDAPGHEQYTRNMVTAASTADVAILLVDAVHGLQPQTRRHAFLARWAGISRLVLAVNKMDLVNWNRERFEAIHAEFTALAAHLGFVEVHAIPLSALTGDMVAQRGDALPWYGGPTLLAYLESVDVVRSRAAQPLRLPVQRVTRTSAAQRGRPQRGLQGTIASGTLEVGMEILVAPAGLRAVVAGIDGPDGPLSVALPGHAVTVRLDRDLDVARGDLLVPVNARPRVTRDIVADLCWFDAEPLQPAANYLIKHTTRTVRARFAEMVHAIDLATLAPVAPPAEVSMNSLVRARLAINEPLAVDAFLDDRTTGAFIVIDEVTNRTVAAGTII